MTVKQLKARIASLDDDCEIHVIHGGLHVPLAAVIGSSNERENQTHGYGLLTGNREVLLAYVDRIEAMIRNAAPEQVQEWQDRLDFWTNSLDSGIFKPKPRTALRRVSHGPAPVIDAEIIDQKGEKRHDNTKR